MKYAIFDVDNTIVPTNMMIESIEFLYKQNLYNKEVYPKFKEAIRKYIKIKDEVSATENAFEVWSKGIKGFDKNKISQKLEDYWNGRFKEFNLTKWKEIMKTLNKNKFQIFLASASCLESVGLLGSHLGVDKVFATEVEEKENTYTGEIKQGIDWNFKKKLAEKYNPTFSVGNAETDYSMLLNSEYGIAFNPNKKLKELIDSSIITCNSVEQVHEFIKLKL